MPTDEVLDSGVVDAGVDGAGQVSDAGGEGDADIGDLGGDSDASVEDTAPNSLGDGDPVKKAATEAYRNLFNRDEKSGQFKKGPDAKVGQKVGQKPAADAAQKAVNTAKPADQQSDKAQQQIDPNRVPDSWTKEAKAMWDGLP